MKPIMIIGISVGFSVIAVLAVLLAISSYQQFAYEKELEDRIKLLEKYEDAVEEFERKDLNMRLLELKIQDEGCASFFDNPISKHCEFLQKDLSKQKSELDKLKIEIINMENRLYP